MRLRPAEVGIGLAVLYLGNEMRKARKGIDKVAAWVAADADMDDITNAAFWKNAAKQSLAGAVFGRILGGTK